MKKLRVLTALLLIVVLSLTGCSNQSKKITLGEINENTYTNDFFGMTFTIDDDWYILSREEWQLFQMQDPKHWPRLMRIWQRRPTWLKKNFKSFVYFSASVGSN